MLPVDRASVDGACLCRHMKLLTHNFLSCHIKGVKNGYPLKIEATKIEETQADYDSEFLRRTFPKLDWSVFKEAAESLGVLGLPDSVSEGQLQGDEDFLQLYHHALLELVLEEGWLVCPETGRKFPVSKGIPNLLLNEDEC